MKIFKALQSGSPATKS